MPAAASSPRAWSTWHARLREPGHGHEGLLESELAAAAAGGVTSLVCPPDTDPPLDEPGLVEMLKFRARKLSRCRLFPLGALTRGLAGEALTEMAELTEAGCIGFSQAEVPVTDTLVLWRALQYAATFGYTVWLRPQDRWLGTGVAASGPIATRLGLSGVPVAAETVALATIFEGVRATGARVHLCRLSSAAGVALLRAAKAEGLPVTADVSINSLHLTDVDIGYFNPAMRLVPPLRSARPRRAERCAR
jgi:dihydroorotase